MIAPLAYLCLFHRGTPPILYVISALAGLLLGTILLGVLLRWNFKPFFTFVFLRLPRYLNIQDGMMFPIRKVHFFIVSILAAINTYWISLRLVEEWQASGRRLALAARGWAEKYFIEIAMLLSSIFIFRTALGRSDTPHVAKCSLLIYLLFFHICIRYIFGPIILSRRRLKIAAKGLAVLITSLLILMCSYNMYVNNVISTVLPLGKDDSEFIYKDCRDTIIFLREHLEEDEYFLTFTNYAIWYYFVNKPSPTRFPAIFFATPDFYQKEIVRDLRLKDVKYVLYRSESDKSVIIDDIENQVRLPIVFDFIRNNYVFLKKIDENHIYAKIDRTNRPYSAFNN